MTPINPTHRAFATIFIALLSFNAVLAQQLTINFASGPHILNDHGRGLSPNVLVKGPSVWTTYQVSDTTILNYGKSIYYKKWKRDLSNTPNETMGVDVINDAIFSSDLNDHNWTLMDNKFYFIGMLNAQDQVAMIIYDTLFNRQSSPVFFGDTATDDFTGMGLTNDGFTLYAVFHSIPDTCQSPSCWGAKIHKLNGSLQHDGNDVVIPETGSFGPGCSVTYVPQGEMNSPQNRLQIFSVDEEFTSTNTIGIHTFASNQSITYILNTTIPLIQENNDVYYPSGVSWNQKHQVWVIGYTQEATSGAFPNEGRGPSYLRIISKTWQTLETFQLNNNNPAMRVRTATLDDDIYVVYDELDLNANTVGAEAKIEHYTMTSCAVTSSMIVNDVKCAGTGSGSATVTVFNGIPPITYVWDNTTGSQTTQTATNLSAGTYTVLSTDSAGCEIIDTAVITEGDKLTMTVDITNPVGDSCTWVVDVSASGGVPDYSFIWGPPLNISTTQVTDLCENTEYC
ncbi:MAG: SprB repeat-containing protein, partial [Bacteroidetes bacterium]|nr:SprB repeat-containing protein [Bacteroidota bacterium]